MSNIEQTVEVLSKVPLFQSLKRKQLTNLARVFSDRKCAKGEVIVPQGRDGYGFFVVVSGAAEVVRERADGTKSVVGTFGPGDFFGEVALLDDGPRTASVIATENVHCLIMPRENFLGTLKRDGEMAVTILVELAKRFRDRLEMC